MRAASTRRVARPGAGEERRRSLALRAGGACACAEGASPPSPRPLPRPCGPARRRAVGRRRAFPGARAPAAPPRSQRAPRGEEAAAAGWGHFVSAVAGVERQDGGGGRVRDRRRPGASGLRVSLPLPPLPLPTLTASPWLPLVFLERAERRPAGERDRAAEGGARRRGPAGAEQRGPAFLILPPLPSPLFPPLPLSPPLGRR